MQLHLKDQEKFQQLAVDALVELCRNEVGGKRVVKLEGCLCLTLETNEDFVVVVKENLSESDSFMSPLKKRRNNASAPNRMVSANFCVLSQIYVLV